MNLVRFAFAMVLFLFSQSSFADRTCSQIEYIDPKFTWDDGSVGPAVKQLLSRPGHMLGFSLDPKKAKPAIAMAKKALATPYAEDGNHWLCCRTYADKKRVTYYVEDCVPVEDGP